MKKRNILILAGIFLVLLLATTFFVSYAYVGSKIVGNNGSTNTFLNQIIKVEYSDGSETLTSNGEGDFIPGAVLEKTFNIKNLSNRDISYAVRLDEVVNEFERKNDLVYELYLNDKLLTKDIYPTKDAVIAYNIFLKENETQTFKLKISYLRSMDNQIVDSGKTISASLNFEERQSSLDNILIYGDSIQDEVPSINNPMEIKSVGNYIDNADNEYFGKYLITFKYNEDSIYEIYLNEPLRCIENTCDYIDFKNKKIIRNIREVNLKDIANPELIDGVININLSDFNAKSNSSILSNYSTIDNIKIEDKILKLTNLSEYWNINNIYNYNNFVSNNNVLVDYVMDTEVSEDIVLPEISNIDSSIEINVNTKVVPSNIKLEYK